MLIRWMQDDARPATMPPVMLNRVSTPRLARGGNRLGRHRTVSGTGRKGGVWQWHGPSFLLGLVSALASVLAVMQGPDWLEGLIKEADQDEVQGTAGADSGALDFQFPDILGTSEVPTEPEVYGPGRAIRQPPPAAVGKDDEGLASAAPAPDPGTGSPVSKPEGDPVDRLFIQAASFRQSRDADVLRARLLLEGLPVQVQSVRLADGAWHRVTIGPVTSGAEARQIMVRLQQQNLGAFLINQS